MTGNLTNHENLVVTGNLTIDGAYIALGEYPCCFVGGSMRAKNYYGCETETTVLETFSVKDTIVLLLYNTVTIARRVEAGTLVNNDASVVGEVAAQVHHEHQGSEVFKDLYGLEFDEDAPDFCAWESVDKKIIEKMLG